MTVQAVARKDFTPKIDLSIRCDASKALAQIESLYEPLNWRQRLVARLAAHLGVRIEIKRSLRGFPVSAGI